MANIDPLARIILDEAIRGLNMQNEALNELRSRTGVLVAAATVASALLGTTALEHRAITYAINLAALAVFGLVIFFCLCVLWPSDKWAFAYSAKDLDETYYEKQVEISQACRSMALGHAESRASNSCKLEWRFWFFRLACIALTVDVILWLVSIGVR